MFEFLKPKTVYYDPLKKWRKIKCGEYNMFDKVIITSIPSYKKDYFGKEGLIIAFNEKNFQEGKAGYEVIMEDGYRFYPWNDIKIKKSYGEFQEEFEAMEQVDIKAKELKELEEKMKKVSGELTDYYKKASKIKQDNIEEIYKKIT